MTDETPVWHPVPYHAYAWEDENGARCVTLYPGEEADEARKAELRAMAARAVPVLVIERDAVEGEAEHPKPSLRLIRGGGSDGRA
ncbi:hypothetical protein [Streptomyces rubellomurinus]|uniref:Uncharacterized protein n=2 Tax=Streptomyces TaxID=1883 RepID=A0A0F2TAL5_STRR3|nr:hypothetical protein [Streptomyces rubellomurinus]KJS53288.1 hypothetical protein VM98_26210 [Streptomyces rubellomurinus subsp. indigoferus]KJS60269.1 hypothetical protein VM95_22315 [Streptomyces rubellomurinus]